MSFVIVTGTIIVLIMSSLGTGETSNASQTIIMAMAARPAKVMVHACMLIIRGRIARLLSPLTSHHTILSMAIAMLAILSVVMI